MTAPGRNRERLALGMLLAALAAAYLVEIRHGLPNRDIVWGYDANPLLPLVAARKVFLDGWNTGWHAQYPNFHCWLLLLILGPYMAAQWLLGNLAGLRMEGGYPYGLKDFDALFMHLAVITRLVAAAMAVGAAYWVYRIGRALHSHRAGMLAACLVGFSPAIVYYVHTETVDVPMMFWLSAALYAYVRALQTLQTRHYVALGILAAIAIGTSHYAFGAFVLLPVPLAAALARQAHGSVSARALVAAAFDRRHAMGLLAFLAALALAENWLWNFSGFLSHVKIAAGLGPDVAHTHTGSSAVSSARFPLSFPALSLVLGWAGSAASVAGMFYALFRERRLAAILIWPAAGSVIFTIWPAAATVSFVERPCLPLAPVLGLMGGIALAQASRRPALIPRTLTAGAIALAGAQGLAMDAALVTDPRYRAEAFLRQNVADAAKVELYGFRSELPRADARWHGTVLNVFPKPTSDLQLTAAAVAPEAVAGRAPDWIVISEAFLAAYQAPGPGTSPAIHDFLERLRTGELRYVETGRFVSRVSDAFGFPSRLTPSVTVYSRQGPRVPQGAPVTR